MKLRWWSLPLIVLMSLRTLPAYADDLADEADLAFHMGAERYQAGDFRGALEKFLVSNRLVPNRNVVFNIARCYEQLRDFPNAWRYYEDARQKEPEAEARARIEEALGRVSPHVAVLAVDSDPPGATVYLDREDLGPRGETPRRLGLLPGRYRVIVRRPGHEAATASDVEVREGAVTGLSLKLVPILGRVRVEGANGAEIRVDDEAGPVLARAPATLSLPPGPHRLFITRPGALPADLNVEVVARRQLVVRPRLAPRTGTLLVATDLRDARVSVDGRTTGFTPTVVTLPVGRHVVRVTLPGFREVVRTVDVENAKETRLELELGHEEQVSAATRTEETVDEAPASVSLVSRAELRAFGYPTIAEALRTVRGVYLSDDRSYGTLGFRGFSLPGDYGNKVLILSDGHPTNDNILGQSFPGYDGRTDLDDVERVEVVRGPGSAFYGTGAFFGVVNVVRHGKGEPSRAEVGVGTSEYGQGRGRILGYQALGDHAGVWTSVAASKGAGRDFHFDEYGSDPATRGDARGVDGMETASTEGRLWWRDFTVQWSWHHRQKAIPTGAYEALFGDPRARFLDRRGFVELRWEPKVGRELQLLTRAHGNVYYFDSTTPYASVDGGPALESYVGQWIGLEERVRWNASRALRLTLGGEGQRHFRASMEGHDDTGSYLDGGQRNPYTVLGVYGVADADLGPRVHASVGARYDAFRWEHAGAHTTNTSVNPRAAVIVKPYRGGVSKVVVGKAFRAPSPYQLFYQGPDQLPGSGADGSGLAPEQVWSGEVEHAHRLSPALTGTLAGFATRVTDSIQLRDLPDPNDPTHVLSRYVNIDSPIFTWGLEAEVRRDFREGWMVAAAYTFQRASYEGGAGLREVPNSPHHLGSIKGVVPLVDRTLVLASRVAVESARADRNQLPDDPPQTHTEGAVIWDLVFSGEAPRGRLRWNVGVYNAMDWRYRAPPSAEFRMTGVAQNGRTFLASTTVTF